MKNLIFYFTGFSIILILTGCVEKSVELVIPPVAPVGLSVSPVSPGNDSTPSISGSSTPETTIAIYLGPNCTGAVAATGSANRSGIFSIPTTPLSDGSYTFSAKAVNSAGHACSSTSVNYTLDTSVPTLTISAPSVSIVNNTGPVNFSVTYTSASNINLSSTAVTLNRTATANCGTVTVTSGTASPATVTLSGCTGNGTIGISIAAGTSTSPGGSPDTGAGPSGTFTVDNTGIASATFNPVSGTYNAIPASVTVTFPETYAGASLTAADFVITGTCTVLPTLAITSTTGTTAVFSLTAHTCSVGQSTIVTLNLTGVNDVAGNPGTGSASATYVFDNIGPTSATFNPVAGDVNAVPASIVITFNEPINTASVASTDFSISGTCATLPTHALSAASGSTATLSLTGGTCAIGATFIVNADMSLIDDINNNTGSGTASATYTFDNVGPVVSSASPATADVQSIPTSVSVVFNENILAGSVVATDLLVTGSCPTLPTVSVSGVTTTTATFGLAGAVCGLRDTVIISLNGSSVQDMAGNNGSGSVSRTYTFDNVGPAPAAVNPILPATGSRNAAPTTVTLTFDENILSSSVQTTDLAVTSNCATPPSVTAVTVTGPQAAFTLSAAVCANGTTIGLSLNGLNVTDAALNAGSGTISATYTIDVVGPTPSSISPASNPFTVMPTSIAVNFDENIASGSVVASDLGISGTCSTLPTAAVLSVSGATANFTLSGGVCAETQTTVLTVNGANFTDIAGNAGSSSQVVTYTKDSTGPTVTSFTPGTSARTSVPASVTVNFSENLLASSVGAADFTASGCTAQPTIGTPTVTGNQVTFTLTGGTCADGQSLLISVVGSGITDPAGNAAANGSASYTLDNTAPTVTGFSPPSGAPPASVQVSFSENLAASSVAIADFTLSGTCTTKTITLNSVVGNLVNIDITGAACISGQTVIINVTTGSVNDVAGNALSGTGSVTFTEP